ncbi:MAG: ribosomal protein S18-alanine N-acetyltransferase [Elusimicrobiaceae bacterium]|nr:ribosomal protein S18-alanine N-acetyltransferase [Elusimicrobiaceae bacterium]
MKYRLAQLADVPSLCHLESLQPRAAQWDEAGWQTELAERSAYILCAQDKAETVGFVALRLAAGICEILNVAVAPSHARQGIGESLLRQAVDWVISQRGEQITLEVGATNRPAIGLYQKVGFKQVGMRKNFYNGNEDALILALQL